MPDIETVPTLSDGREVYAPRDEVFNERCFAVFDFIWDNRGEIARRLAVAAMTGGMALLFGRAAYVTLFPERKRRRRP